MNCRVIAGTNRLLDRSIFAGQFREDLYYRLNVFRIDLPSLRERPDDILPLAEHFLAELAERRREPPKRLDDAAAGVLRRHRWDGNVRELKNVIERASIVCTGRTIRAGDLRIQRRDLVAARAVGAAGAIMIPSGGMSIDEIEREAIRITMQITEGNLAAAARILGMSRPRLIRRMRLSGLTRRSILASM